MHRVKPVIFMLWFATINKDELTGGSMLTRILYEFFGIV